MRVKLVLLGQQTVPGSLDVSDVGPLVVAGQSDLGEGEGGHTQPRPRYHTTPQ